MKKISIVTSCFNEKNNIVELYTRFNKVFNELEKYELELLIIDNSSTDGTKEEITKLCQKDKRVKAIFNSRNFGHIRSPYHALMNATGDAMFTTVSDLQVDPEIIVEFIDSWEAGADLVIGIRESSFFSVSKLLSRAYYYIINKLSDTPQRKSFIGIGLYDKKVVGALKKFNDPYPYFRGMVFEVGFSVKEVCYQQKRRKHGISKNNFLTLFDLAMLGICTHSKIPLRLATITGFTISVISFFVSLFYLLYKLLNWDSFQLGTAPVVIGIFFLGSLQLLFLGIIGEYVGFILTKVQSRPLVVEEKRLNF